MTLNRDHVRPQDAALGPHLAQDALVARVICRLETRAPLNASAGLGVAVVGVHIVESVPPGIVAGPVARLHCPALDLLHHKTQERNGAGHDDDGQLGVAPDEQRHAFD